MGLLDSVSPRAIATSALLLGSLAQGVFARPSPEPKSDWVRKGPGGSGGYFKKKVHDQIRRAVGGAKRTAELESCAETTTTTITAPKPNPWAPLSNEETASVVEWLFSRGDLNLTTTEDATAWDNSIVLVESMWPNKTDAVNYLDANAAAPTKYAHVILNNRATVDAHYADILVGPLPIDSATTWSPLEFPYTKKSGGTVRNLDADQSALYSEWIYPISASIADITLDLWNATGMGLDNDTLSIWGIDPLWQDDGRVTMWSAFWNSPTGDFDDSTVLPLGLYFRSDVTGRDPSQWTFEGWLYNDIFYETTEEFRAAYWSEGFVKNSPNVDGQWAQTGQVGKVEPLDLLPPPVQVAPAGSRYAVDPEQQYVEWMGFSFYVGFTRDAGMALYDIRYQGERIMYELSLQEALAHYAGNDPMQSGTAYLDTFYGFGPYAFELVPGYDCPAHATYLNSSFYVDETCRTHINSICLFEFEADHPIQRHSTSKYVSITKNTYFVIRYVATVGNYDYMFSYSFFLDGSIAVEVRASGYIQSAYFANNHDYGFQIHDSLSGSMHDHVLNFKADFDILGTSNSLELVSLVPHTTTYSWSKTPRNTMKIDRKFIESEDEGQFNWGANSATQVIIVNENATNKYGEYRGYRVLPYTGTAHLTVKGSSNLNNAAHWAEHDIVVTKRKDTEYRSTHPLNNQDTFEPPIDFSKFLDGENLRDEDLVLWLNLGMHHIPHTGDLPNTVQTTAHSGVQFMPSNYFLEDQSRRTVNQVHISYGEGEAAVVERFGQFEASSENATCKPNYEPVEENLEAYVGDIVVRKFPFDPNNPFYQTDAIGKK
ncbi:membrane copper amine oxidase [Immersiella caudata]|uniref:Amine oxidase n=1 Tax=Immersiella caudata TaxID=314043 RepID=A0AA39TN03_9PEZI|nr:membrane copper amine oxidase [Immersiella caudata]